MRYTKGKRRGERKKEGEEQAGRAIQNKRQKEGGRERLREGGRGQTKRREREERKQEREKRA